MSLILEALKKSEARRQLGEAPGIGTPFTVAPRRRNVLPVLVALILVAGGLGWYFLLRSPPVVSDAGKTGASAGQTIALTAPAPAPAAPPPASAAPTRPPGAANVPNVAAAGEAARGPFGARPGDAPGALQPFRAAQPPAAAANGVTASVPASPAANPDPARGRFAAVQGNAAQRALEAAHAGQPPAAEQPGSLPQRVMQARDPRARVPGGFGTPTQAANTAGNAPTTASRNVAGTVAAPNPTDTARAPALAATAAAPGAATASSRTPVVASAPVTAMHPADTPTGAATPAGTAVPPPGTPKSPGAPLASDVPLYYELPFNVRKDLPNLTISMHVYSAAPDQRFVMIDGERRAEGETFKDVTLREIRPDGMVLEFRGQRFFYPRTGH